MSELIDLTFLSEDEEDFFRNMLNEELQLQQAEEIRLKYAITGHKCLDLLVCIFCSLFRQLRKEIEDDSKRHTRPIENARSFCCRCGIRFGAIFNKGALCPTCAERVCKRDRLYSSFNHSWICTLCDKRM